MQRGFVSVVLLLLVLLIGITLLTYLFISRPWLFNSSLQDLNQPKLELTVKQKNDVWNNYRDDKFSFEFENGLKVVEDSEVDYSKRNGGDTRKNFTGYIKYEPGVVEKALGVVDNSNSDLNKSPFVVWIFNNPNNLNEIEWFNKFWYYPFVWGDFSFDTKNQVAPKETATVSGELARSAVVSYQPGKPKFTYINKNGKMYLFRTINTEVVSGDKILESFKWAGSSIEKTQFNYNQMLYTNKVYKFSFNYLNDVATADTKLGGQDYKVSFSKGEEKFQLVITNTNGLPSFASRLKPEQTLNVNNNSWLIYPAIKYCDGGNCSSTYKTYETAKGDYYFDFLLENVDSKSTTFTTVLNSFKFL